MKNIEVVTLNKEGIVDFAKERNLLLSKAKKEWVMFVDLDEVVTPELSKEIDTLDFKKDGYYIKRRNLFLGRAVGEDKVLRLGRKTSGKWKNAIHEVWDIGGNTDTLNNYLIHDTAPSLRYVISKTDTYSTLQANEKLRKGIRSNIFKITFFPIGRFIGSLITGQGFPFAMTHSFHSFLSWSKLYLWQKDSR